MKYLIVAISCFVVVCTSAQTENSNIVIGTHHTIKSTILNQDRTIQIFVPDGYDRSEESYPVLYILDGQWYFINGISIQKTTRASHYFPDMIVVGIQTANPLRRSLYSSKRKDFLSFIENELITYIDSTYRTNGTRILFGWENAAKFASYALFNEKQLFNAVIGTNGAYATREEIATFDALENITDKYLYISGSTKDIYSINYFEEFSESLKEIKPKNLIYKSQLFNDEIHESLAYLAMYHGLRHYYYNYPSLDFSNIQEYEELGGIDYLTNYFQERGERFNLSTDIDNAVKNTLIWMAWKRDDFEYFQFFMTEFEEVLATRRYTSGYWQNRFGQFYLKHKDFENAINYFKHGIATYPKATQLKQMYIGLGNAFENSGKANKAKKVFMEASLIEE